MAFIDKKSKLEYLIELIRTGRGGSTHELSEKICVSRRTLFRYLDLLRTMDYHIVYCTRSEKYYLVHPTDNKD